MRDLAILTFLTIAISLVEPATAPSAQDYATQFLKLESVTRFVGVAYVLTLAIWIAFLHTGTINEVD